MSTPERQRCGTPMIGLYGAESSCAKPMGHPGEHDSIRFESDWAQPEDTDGREVCTPEQDRLAEIKQRAENATPGPWVRPPSAGTEGDGLGEQWIHNSEAGAKEYAVAVAFFANPRLEEDAEFIAHSRADVDYLIAEVERLRAALCGIAEDLDIADPDQARTEVQQLVAELTEERAETDSLAAEVERLRAALPAKDGAE